jgi:hypothetical protein
MTAKFWLLSKQIQNFKVSHFSMAKVKKSQYRSYLVPCLSLSFFSSSSSYEGSWLIYSDERFSNILDDFATKDTIFFQMQSSRLLWGKCHKPFRLVI